MTTAAQSGDAAAPSPSPRPSPDTLHRLATRSAILAHQDTAWRDRRYDQLLDEWDVSAPSLDEEELCSCTEFGEICAMPATFYVTAGCVHEHFGTRSLCEHHTERVRDRDPRLGCGYCRTAGHACDLIIAEIKPIYPDPS